VGVPSGQRSSCAAGQPGWHIAGSATLSWHHTCGAVAAPNGPGQLVGQLVGQRPGQLVGQLVGQRPMGLDSPAGWHRSSGGAVAIAKGAPWSVAGVSAKCWRLRCTGGACSTQYARPGSGHSELRGHCRQPSGGTKHVPGLPASTDCCAAYTGQPGTRVTCTINHPTNADWGPAFIAAGIHGVVELLAFDEAVLQGRWLWCLAAPRASDAAFFRSHRPMSCKGNCSSPATACASWEHPCAVL
jgi:hypothetical protein